MRAVLLAALLVAAAGAAPARSLSAQDPVQPEPRAGEEAEGVPPDAEGTPPDEDPEVRARPREEVLRERAAQRAAARADSAAAAADSARAAAGDTAAGAPETAAPADTPAVADTLAALPDTLRQRILARTPLFPEDVDPWTPVGLGPPDRVVEREELDGWAGTTLADILPTLLPLAVDDQGGPGFHNDLRFPDGDASATRILIDGRPLESPLGPAADLRGVPLTAIERIEIRRGPAPVTGGAEAGTVHVITRTHLAPQASSALRFELGSFDREGFGAVLGRWLGSRVSAFGSLHFDDHTTFTRVADAARSRFWTRLRVYPAGGHFVEASLGTSGVTTDTRRSTPADPSPFAGAEDRHERRLGALYRGAFGPVRVSLRGWSDRFEEREGFTIEGAAPVTGAFRRRGAAGGARFGIPGGEAEAGVEWLEEEADSESEVFAGIEAGEKLEPTTRLAGSAGVEVRAGPVDVSARARLERFELGAGSATEPAAVAEARWRAPAGFEPFVRLGRSTRAPSLLERALIERAGLFPAAVATAREARVGSAWRRGDLAAAIAVFERTSEDAPFWTPPTAWRSATDGTTLAVAAPFEDLNVLDVRARGVVARAEAPLAFGVRAQGAAQLQSVETGDGREMPYAASAYAVGRLDWRRRFFPSGNLEVRAALDGRVTGARPTADGDELPAHALTDGLLRVRLIGFTLGLWATNVFDLRYRTEEGLPLPGRVVGFEVFWEFWN
jgi:outer membrane cobalamin receptor